MAPSSAGSGSPPLSFNLLPRIDPVSPLLDMFYLGSDSISYWCHRLLVNALSSLRRTLTSRSLPRSPSSSSCKTPDPRAVSFFLFSTSVSHSDTGFCCDLCRQLHVYKYRVVNQLMLWSSMILDLPMLFSFVKHMQCGFKSSSSSTRISTQDYSSYVRILNKPNHNAIKVLNLQSP
jgi:hypothetical protein